MTSSPYTDSELMVKLLKIQDTKLTIKLKIQDTQLTIKLKIQNTELTIKL